MKMLIFLQFSVSNFNFFNSYSVSPTFHYYSLNSSFFLHACFAIKSGQSEIKKYLRIFNHKIYYKPMSESSSISELISHQSRTKHQGIITVSLLQPGVSRSSTDPTTFINSSKLDPPCLQPLGNDLLQEDGDVEGLEETLLAEVQFGGNPDDPETGAAMGMVETYIASDLVPPLPKSNPSRTSCTLCGKSTEENDHVCPLLSYNCDVCPEVLRSKVAYRTHLSKVHNLSESRIYECDQCMRMFTAQSSLQYHRDSTHSTLTYKCEAEGCQKVILRDRKTDRMLKEWIANRSKRRVLKITNITNCNNNLHLKAKNVFQIRPTAKFFKYNQF